MPNQGASCIAFLSMINTQFKGRWREEKGRQHLGGGERKEKLGERRKEGQIRGEEKGRQNKWRGERNN